MNTTTAADLAEMMRDVGRALFDDAEWNAPLYRDGTVVGLNGVNASEAARALDSVAGLLGIPGPSQEYERLCTAE